MSPIEALGRALKSAVANVRSPSADGSRPSARRRTRVFEQLEPRMMMSVTQNAAGWTVVTPSEDSRVIYVSDSAGNDANDGLTAATAKKTIAAGAALMRSGCPDELLLKRGDTWTDQYFGNVVSGRSASEPAYFGAYGDGARPIIECPEAGAPGGLCVGFFNDHDIVFQGLHLTVNHVANIGGPQGIVSVGNTVNSNILIEDCIIEEFSIDISIGGVAETPGSNFAIRRNVIRNAWTTTGHSQGLFATKVDGLLIEENVFDHNGWKPGTTSSTLASEGGPTTYNHNMYITKGVVDSQVINNIISRAADSGLKFQPVSGTHVVSGNLFVRNGLGAQLGTYPSDFTVANAGINLTADDNVFVEGEDRGTSGWGAYVSNTLSGSFSNNIIANRISTSPNNVAFLIIDGGGLESQGIGVHDFVVDGNIIYNWRGKIRVVEPTQGDPLPTIENVDFTNNLIQEPNTAYPLFDTYTTDTAVNEFSGNTYYCGLPANQWLKIDGQNKSFDQWTAATGETTAKNEQVSFFDPTRTTVTYAATLGLTSYEELVSQFTAQSQSNWRTEYTAQAINAYIREGFELDPVGVTPLPSPSLGAPPPASAPAEESVNSTEDGQSSMLPSSYMDAVGADAQAAGEVVAGMEARWRGAAQPGERNDIDVLIRQDDVSLASSGESGLLTLESTTSRTAGVCAHQDDAAESSDYVAPSDDVFDDVFASLDDAPAGFGRALGGW